jgi:serine/threonine protein kinase/WD40 repeat protein
MTQAQGTGAAFHARVTDLFLAAADLERGERAAFVDAACGGDAKLRAAVERMLAGDEGSADFLAPLPGPASNEASGRRVGPYRLEREIGSGGMGSVWLAERVDGQFQKRVALKLVKRGMDTESVVRRFRLERQVLADLEHPRIARLLDGGSTEEGLPYLVMELVEGRPLLAYCAEQDLDLDERLRLFQKVCEVVHFAHEHHVVHRDLKPSNVLVGADGEPKLLDFGIAKVLEAGVAVETLELTRTGERFLSPRYASPEQLRGDPVGPASDVYALGVILYELLTTFHPHGWTTTSWREFEQEVLEREATPPSRALRARADAAEPREGRRARTRRLRGDLDTIVLTALQKEPARRYASARALALDVERHLAGLPIHARPDSRAYRAAKFVRRNRGLVAGTGAFVLLLLIALGVVLKLYADSLRAQQLALWEAYVGHVAAAENALVSARVSEARAHLDLAPEGLRDWEWRHLRTRLDRSRRTLETAGHGAFALDGARGRLAVAQHGRLEVRELESFALLLTTESVGPRPTGAWKGCVDLAFSADGVHLVSVWDGGDLFVHDLAAGGTLAHRGDPGSRYASAAFHPSQDRLVVGTMAGELLELDPASGAVGARRAAHAQQVTALAFDPAGGVLASTSWDESARLWTAAALEPLHVLRGHTMAVTSAAFAPDGMRLVTCSLDQSVRVWEVATGAALHVHHVKGGFDGAALFAPGGDDLLVTLRGGIEVLGAATREKRTLWLGHEDAPTRLALDVARGRAWSKGAEVLKEWSLDTRDVRTLPACEFSEIVCFDPRGGRLANAGPDRRIRLWSWPEGASLGELEAASGMLVGLRFHAREEQLYSLDEHGGLSLWDLDERRLVQHAEPAVRAGEPAAFEIASDAAGTLLLCFLETALELRAADATLLRTLEPPPGTRLTDSALDPRGRLVAAVDVRGRTFLWDAGSGELRATLAPPAPASGPALAVAFDPAGELVATGFVAGAIALHESATGRVRVVLTESRQRIDALAFHPHGHRLASGGMDGTIRLWDVPTGRLVATLSGHAARISSLDFSPDGATLASSSDDASVRLWETTSLP